jgi:hypothetical protein
MLAGLLLGMSGSPVVAATLGALIPFAIAFLTWFASNRALKRGGDAATDQAAGYASVVAGFGVAAVAATLFGVAARANDWLSPSPATLVNRWREAGFGDEDARKLAVQALSPGATTAREGKSGGESAPGPALIRTVLFSGKSEKSFRDLAPMLEEAELGEIEKSFEKQGGLLGSAVEVAREMEEGERREFLVRCYQVLERSADE